MPKENDFETYIEKVKEVNDLLANSSDIEKEQYVSKLDSIEKETRLLIAKGEDANGGFGKSIKKLDEMIKSINERKDNSYLFSLCVDSVKEIIDTIDENNYDEVKTIVFRLIDNMNQNNSDEAYNLIYKSLLNEEIIGECEILDHLLYCKNQSLTQKIHQLIKEGINTLPTEQKINIEMNYRGTFLNTAILKIIAVSVLKTKNEEYENRKQTVLMDVLKQRDAIVSKKNKLAREYDFDKRRIITDLLGSLLRIARKSPGVLIPIFILIGAVYGGMQIKKSYKYDQTSYYLNTKKIISEDSFYSEDKSNYLITVKRYSPWMKSTFSDGYYREALEYQCYELDDDVEVPDIDTILSSITPRYYTQTKMELEETDSMEDEVIVVTEQFRDRNTVRPGYAVAIIFGMLACVVDAGIFSALKDDKYFHDKDFIFYKNDFASTRVHIKHIKEEYVEVGRNILKLQNEVSNKTMKYSELVSVIDPELLKSAKKYCK